MTTTNDRVLAAISDGETSVKGICETTGLEPNAVHQAAFLLKKAGSIVKGENGYELTDAAAAPAADPPPAIKAKRKYTRRATKERKTPKVKRTPKKRSSKRALTIPAQSNGHAGNGHAVEFARFGEYVVLKRTDVVDLLRTMQRWSDMVEGMLA